MVTLLALAIIITLLFLSGHFSVSKSGHERISEEMKNYVQKPSHLTIVDRRGLTTNITAEEYKVFHFL